MIQINQRLEFSNVFPEEQEKDILEYLSIVPEEFLLKTIGFCNTKPLPNFDSFFTDPDLQTDIFSRVNNYSIQNKVRDKPELISQLASLKLAEKILSNKDKLFGKKVSSTIDEQELALFKAFLVINGQLNENQVIDNISGDNNDKLVDYSIIFSFPHSDLAIFENDDKEFVQLIYTTTVKIDYLFQFLNSMPELEILKNELIQSFNLSSQEEFEHEMKYLFGALLLQKVNNNYILEVKNKKSKSFLEAMISDDILEDDDFTNVKINPIFKIKGDQFSVVNYYFVIDKFFRSAKFKIKETYEAQKDLKKKNGNFFSFFNKEFSENFLMKNVLDELFHQKYIFKKEERDKELPGESDYYARHGNNIFIFENKDVLIAKDIKASGDISKIDSALKQKFLGDSDHRVGIGQLINTIVEILGKKFRFDEYINSKNNLKIYPILLVHDRIFQTVGINYKLNKWYLEEVQKELKEKYNSSNIKDLTVIDIDTIILWLPYLKKKDRNFRNILDKHLDKQKTKLKVNTSDYNYGQIIANRKLTDQITPITHRPIDYVIPIDRFTKIFKDVLK